MIFTKMPLSVSRVIWDAISPIVGTISDTMVLNAVAGSEFWVPWNGVLGPWNGVLGPWNGVLGCFLCRSIPGLPLGARRKARGFSYNQSQQAVVVAPPFFLRLDGGWVQLWGGLASENHAPAVVGA